MTERNRAWRRRKTRIVVQHINRTQNWLKDKLKEVGGKKALIPHQHGKLTRVQSMRLEASLIQESFDTLSPI